MWGIKLCAISEFHSMFTTLSNEPAGNPWRIVSYQNQIEMNNVFNISNNTIMEKWIEFSLQRGEAVFKFFQMFVMNSNLSQISLDVSLCEASNCRQSFTNAFISGLVSAGSWGVILLWITFCAIWKADGNDQPSVTKRKVYVKEVQVLRMELCESIFQR